MLNIVEVLIVPQTNVAHSFPDVDVCDAYVTNVGVFDRQCLRDCLHAVYLCRFIISRRPAIFKDGEYFRIHNRIDDRHHSVYTESSSHFEMHPNETVFNLTHVFQGLDSKATFWLDGQHIWLSCWCWVEWVSESWKYSMQDYVCSYSLSPAW